MGKYGHFECLYHPPSFFKLSGTSGKLLKKAWYWCKCNSNDSVIYKHLYGQYVYTASLYTKYYDSQQA